MLVQNCLNREITEYRRIDDVHESAIPGAIVDRACKKPKCDKEHFNGVAPGVLYHRPRRNKAVITPFEDRLLLVHNGIQRRKRNNHALRLAQYKLKRTK